MKIIIIEDNEFDQKILENLINKQKDLEHKGTFADALHAISLIRTIKPDLIFLDVELPGMNGFEFLEALKEVPQIIMVTSHEQFAVKGFENDVTDFIVKPVSNERFLKAIDKAKQLHEWLSLNTDDQDHITIRCDRENIKIFNREIQYIEAMGDYVKIHLEDKKVVALYTMKSIESLLSENFVRIHRSFIVNMDHVTNYSAKGVGIGDLSLQISRAGYTRLRNLMKQ